MASVGMLPGVRSTQLRADANAGGRSHAAASDRLEATSPQAGDTPTGDKATKANRDDRGFRTASEHDICLAVPDVHACGMVSIVGCGACCGDGVVGAHEALVNGHESRAHVGDGVRDEERRDALVALHQHRRSELAAGHGPGLPQNLT